LYGTRVFGGGGMSPSDSDWRIPRWDEGIHIVSLYEWENLMGRFA